MPLKQYKIQHFPPAILILEVQILGQRELLEQTSQMKSSVLFSISDKPGAWMDGPGELCAVSAAWRSLCDLPVIMLEMQPGSYVIL